MAVPGYVYYIHGERMKKFRNKIRANIGDFIVGRDEGIAPYIYILFLLYNT